MLQTRLAVAIERTAVSDKITVPHYKTAGAAGFDLQADLVEPLTIKPLDMVTIPTGLRFAIPEGYEMQVRPRSGLAANHLLTIMNSPGTVDSDYRGEVFVLLTNLGSGPYVVQPGDRIAQGVVCPVTQADLVLVESLPETERGAGKFGSTGR